jgi:hypothetical protein
MPLAIHSHHLLFRRRDHGRFFGTMGRRLGVKGVKNRGANENGKEKGYNVHTCAEQEGLPAADCVKSSSVHWILD